jgi:hypothetical protein
VPRNLLRLILLFIGAVVVLLAFASIRALFDTQAYERYAAALQRDLGFGHGSPYVLVGNSRKELMTIEHVTPDGVFDRAGIRSGDIPLDDLSIAGFYRWLDASRGQTVTISVADGGDGPPLRERPKRSIEVVISARK